MWRIGRITPEFIWRMEDVLHQHELPYDPGPPRIDFDERPCQLIGDVAQPTTQAPSTRFSTLRKIKAGLQI